LSAVLALAGCAGLVEQLKDDPAIVGGTFTGIKLSLTAIPGVPIPIPEILIGRGTFYRIGGNRAVEVMAGDTVGAALSDPNSKVGIAQTKSQSEASMTIKAGELIGKPPLPSTKLDAPPRATIR